MATRYSGELRVNVVYRDAGHYDCRVWLPGSGTVWRGTVRPAASWAGRIALDSSAAYDSTAHAALSFACDEGWPVDESAAVNPDMSGWHVARTYARRWPEIPAESPLGKAVSSAIATVNAAPVGEIHVCESELAANGYGAYCKHCGETLS